MKKLLSALLVLALSCQIAYAANTVTAQTALPISVGGSNGVIPTVVTIDTTASDVTLLTPDSNKMACVASVFMSEGTAANLTFKSGSTTYAIPELASNQGILTLITRGVLFCGQPGEAVKVQSSAAVSFMLFNMIQASRLQF